MVFLSLFRQNFLLSYNQFRNFICETRLPFNFVLLRTSNISTLFFTFIFKNYVFSLQSRKDELTEKMISFFIRLRNEKGIRHLFHLPVRGQHSKTNANTQRRQGKVLSKNQLKKLSRLQMQKK